MLDGKQYERYLQNMAKTYDQILAMSNRQSDRYVEALNQVIAGLRPLSTLTVEHQYSPDYSQGVVDTLDYVKAVVRRLLEERGAQ